MERKSSASTPDKRRFDGPRYVGSVVIDVNDIEAMRSFWQPALGYELAYAAEHDWVKLVDPTRAVLCSLS